MSPPWQIALSSGNEHLEWSDILCQKINDPAPLWLIVSDYSTLIINFPQLQAIRDKVDWKLRGFALHNGIKVFTEVHEVTG